MNKIPQTQTNTGKEKKQQLSVLENDFSLSFNGFKFIGKYDCNFFDNRRLTNLVENIENVMNAGDIIKKDYASFISLVTFNNTDIIIKEHCHRDFIHSFRHTFKKSRASNSWYNAKYLLSVQIPTPQPLAYIEQYRGLLFWQSYIIIHYIKARRLLEYIADKSIDTNRQKQVLDQIERLIEKLGRNKVVHGDLQFRNIMITENGPFIIDLDVMKIPIWNWLFKFGRSKDIARYNKDLHKHNLPLIKD
jgi:tRNA A-37 threonylcarbamoyl transferase component Bud32